MSIQGTTCCINAIAAKIAFYMSHVVVCMTMAMDAKEVMTVKIITELFFVPQCGHHGVVKMMSVSIGLINRFNPQHCTLTIIVNQLTVPLLE